MYEETKRETEGERSREKPEPLTTDRGDRREGEKVQDVEGERRTKMMKHAEGERDIE